MTITTPALAAHYRLMQQLPVRTHKRPEQPDESDKLNPAAATTLYRRKLIEGWLAMPEGPTQYEMGQRLGITRRSVQYHVQAIRDGGRKALFADCGLGKTPMQIPESARWREYEAQKQRWLAAHPEATSEEYERAIAIIRERCGV